jgi:hypothetical protein
MDQHNHEFPLVALNVTAGGRVLAHHVNYGAAALQPLSEDIVEKARKLSNGMKGLGEAVTRVSMIL